MTYDFDFLNNSTEANREAVLLAKVRYNEQLAPFVSSRFARDTEARLSYASDHIERIIDECCEACPGADKEVVGPRVKEIIAREVATTQPEKHDVDTPFFEGRGTTPDRYGEAEVGNAVQQDILDREGILVDEILDPDARVDADTPISEGTVQYPKVACSRCENETDNGVLCEKCEEAIVPLAAGYNYPQGQTLQSQPAQPMAQPQPAQPAQPTQQMKCDVCGFTGNAQQVQDHYQKMVAANDQLHMQAQPAMGQQPGIVQASRKEGWGKKAPGDVYGPEIEGEGIPLLEKYHAEDLERLRGLSNETLNKMWNYPQYKELRADVEEILAERGVEPMPTRFRGDRPTESDRVGPGVGLASVKEAAYHYIRKEGDEWCIWQKSTGKTLSCHASKEKAEEAFRAMMANKHGADESFLERDHNREERAEGNPVHQDSDKSDTDPSDRFDDVVQQIADRAAAKRYSQADDTELDQIASRYGLSHEEIAKRLHIVSYFGDYIGFNGDLVDSDPSLEGLTAIDDQDLGGQVESHEALVPLNIAVKATAEELHMNENDVYSRIQDSLGGTDLPNQYHASVEGQRNFYLPDSMVSSGQSSQQDSGSEQDTGQTT
jgi:hypothetical protein